MNKNTAKFSSLKITCIVFVFCVASAISSPAQTVTPLANFNGTNGENPYASLIQGTDGNFYGTTFEGGASGNCPPSACGTVFKVTPGGTLTVLHNFEGTDGQNPYGPLIQGTDGNFYGTTSGVPVSGQDGTVFKITSGGTLTRLHTFNGTDGAVPKGGLIQATDGNFYGTTVGGGAGGVGTVFKITPRGTLTTLHNFGTNGESPVGPLAGLIQATDGNFYGTTSAGTSHRGTVYKITPGGTLTTLHTLSSTEGFGPTGLVQAKDGNFYGTATFGGANSAGCFNAGCGTVFKVTPAGTLTVLYSFQGGADGGEPGVQQLVQAKDGNFYGATTLGGTSKTCAPGCGTLFKITPGGTLTTLHSSCSETGCADGSGAQGGLIQATSGSFYGAAFGGGADSLGVVFRLDVGLGPFVETRRTSGKVGQTVQVLGQGFTGATAVSFNETPATFTVISDTYLTATVPAGATTGFVSVGEPSGTLTSNKIFHITPQISGFSPSSGPIGASVVITGQSFTGATEVVFASGKKALFTVNSDTQITATVPAGAMNGKIGVGTPGGAVASPTSFTVSQ